MFNVETQKNNSNDLKDQKNEQVNIALTDKEKEDLRLLADIISNQLIKDFYDQKTNNGTGS